MSGKRKAMLAKVHIGKKQLGWDDGVYRACLAGRFGRESAGDLDDRQLADLVAYLKSQGARFTESGGKRRQRPRRAFYHIPDGTPHAEQKRLIAALWRGLGWDARGLDTRCRKQFKVASFAWLNDQGDLQILAKDLMNRIAKAEAKAAKAARQAQEERA